MLNHVKRFAKSLILRELFQGLKLTGSYFLDKKVTVQFPDEQTPISPYFKGVVGLRTYPNGEERCIGCRLCEAVCPALAISMDVEQREDGSRRTTRYDVNAFMCINCGLCETVCPVDAIVCTSHRHYHMENRGENILTKDKLLLLGELNEEHYQKKMAKMMEEHAVSPAEDAS